MIRRSVIVLVVFVGLALSSSAFAGGKAEPIGAFAGSAPESIKAAIEAAGYRVSLTDGSVACEIWFRKNGPGLKAGTLVGVVTLAKDHHDFRGQTVKPGTYTLRYSQMPDDGNHLGTAPTMDFLVLVPVADDTAAEAEPAFKDLVQMSIKASGTKHVAPLNLADVSSQKEFPAVAKNELEHEVFFVKLKTKGGETPLGLVVKGETEH